MLFVDVMRIHLICHCVSISLLSFLMFDSVYSIPAVLQMAIGQQLSTMPRCQNWDKLLRHKPSVSIMGMAKGTLHG